MNVLYCLFKTLASNSLVVVLPLDPVIPITFPLKLFLKYKANSLKVSLVSLTFKTAKSLLVKSLSTITHTHFLIFVKYLCPSFKAIKHSFFFNVLVSILKPKISLFKYLELLI